MLTSKPKMKMKRKLQNSMFVALVAVSFFSCKDDEEDKKPANQFTYDAQTKSLTTGVIFLDQAGTTQQDNSTVYFHEITIISDGLAVVNEDIVGTGDALNIKLVSSTLTLDAGEYNFNAVVDTEESMDFVGGVVAIDYNATNGEGPAYDGFSAGKVTIAKSGTQYTVDLDATVDGKPLKAHFSGEFVIILD
jgi:hypothetical protein